MNLLHDIPLSALHLYLTAPYPCSYLPEQQARSQVATPSFLITTPVYSDLVRRGFRRSGTFTYRPRCDTCRACVPVRIEVDTFAPSRAQRRVAKRHQGLEASLHALKDSEEHFALYQRYQIARHRDDGMESDSHEQYCNFLLHSHVDSMLVEFRENGALRMVSIIDILEDGLSSVYTFYEPDVAQASFGTYSILWQVELCRKLELDYLYLGYWIKESGKMAYKANFRPLQGLIQGEWQTLAIPDAHNNV
ncbi:MAG: arginyltransferase [Betaproteobacteria bacterium]|nr:arginyltransferase [Betaproteobacteria bacterium]